MEVELPKPYKLLILFGLQKKIYSLFVYLKPIMDVERMKGRVWNMDYWVRIIIHISYKYPITLCSKFKTIWQTQFLKYILKNKMEWNEQV